MNFIISKVCELMREAAVIEAIHIAKDELIKFNGQIIKDKVLEKLLERLHPILSNVDITRFINECREAFDNNDWTIQNNGGGIDLFNF